MPRFRSLVKTQEIAGQPEPIHFVTNFVKFVQEVLGPDSKAPEPAPEAEAPQS